MKRPYVSAFTLLELMIVLAIAATLAVFAVPAYRSHIARTHRVDAASALYRAAQFIEGATVCRPCRRDWTRRRNSGCRFIACACCLRTK